MSVVRSAEAVCIGHPDKLCDLIADQVLDDVIRLDPAARVAVEAMAAGHRIIVTGQVSSTHRPRIRDSVRTALWKAGYKPWRFLIYVWVNRQSADIDAGVSTSLEARSGDTSSNVLLGAGDQGTVYGYATDETTVCLPLPLVLARDICRRLDTARVQGVIEGIKSDGKAQVSVRYNDNGCPLVVESVVVSIQHQAGKDLEVLDKEVRSLIIGPACEEHLPLADDAVILVNPAGRFVAGGPKADTGLSGRKLMVDTYGGLAAHGGGAFSGKDASKVDRTGAYMARLIAKTIVKTGLACRCQVSVSYAIGKADPLAFTIDTFGTGKHSDEVLGLAAREVFGLRPAAVIEVLGLRKPGFSRLSTYGHFGDNLAAWEWTLPWENKLVEAVRTHAYQNHTDK